MEWEQIAGVTPPVDEDAVMAEVAEFVGAHGAKVPAPVRAEPWRITSVGEADWAMRRLAEARDRVQHYQDEVARWQDALRRIQSAGQFFEDRLEEWAISERTEHRKSFPLAHGLVSTRKSAEAIVVTDEAALLAHAEQTPSLLPAVKVTKSWSLSEMKSLEHPPRIADVIVGYEAVRKDTGETERIDVMDRPVLDPVKVDALRERMGDEWAVTPLTERAVVDQFGSEVPGLGVRDARVTASVAVDNF